jgi:hypothetical protein
VNHRVVEGGPEDGTAAIPTGVRGDDDAGTRGYGVKDAFESVEVDGRPPPTRSASRSLDLETLMCSTSTTEYEPTRLVASRRVWSELGPSSSVDGFELSRLALHLALDG